MNGPLISDFDWSRYQVDVLSVVSVCLSDARHCGCSCVWSTGLVSEDWTTVSGWTVAVEWQQVWMISNIHFHQALDWSRYWIMGILCECCLHTLLHVSAC